MLLEFTSYGKDGCDQAECAIPVSHVAMVVMTNHGRHAAVIVTDAHPKTRHLKISNTEDGAKFYDAFEGYSEILKRWNAALKEVEAARNPPRPETGPDSGRRPEPEPV
jgi:hypothetical protein